MVEEGGSNATGSNNVTGACHLKENIDSWADLRAATEADQAMHGHHQDSEGGLPSRCQTPCCSCQAILSFRVQTVCSGQGPDAGIQSGGSTCLTPCHPQSPACCSPRGDQNEEQVARVGVLARYYSRYNKVKGRLSGMS